MCNSIISCKARKLALFSFVLGGDMYKAVLALLVIVGIFMGFAVYNSISGQINTISQLRQDMDYYNNEQDINIYVYTQRTAEIKEVPHIIVEISTYMQNYDIEQNRLEIGSTTYVGNILTTDLLLTGTGSYIKLLAYIDHIQGLEYMVIVNNIDIKSQDYSYYLELMLQIVAVD